MFLSTTSMMFLSTAYLCIKGPTGLPSLLPTRECLDMAKQKNRRVRILCKGLESFREALYSEAMVDATSKKDESAPVASPVADATADNKSSVSAGTTAEATPSSVKKSCTFYTADGGELFKPLFSAQKTAPNSPGSVATSSTAVGPSSRKVSPSGSDIKDFAYSSSDEHHVIDPTPIIKETTRKQLLKQLKKTAATEEKPSRKVVKLAAENEALNAELTSANATVRNRDAQTDLAKTFANAMILSNIVLRQAVLDVGHQVISDNDNPKGDTLQEHLRIMDAVSVSAHSGMVRLENHSAGQVQTDAVQSIGRGTTEEEQPKSSVEESELSNTQIQRRSTVANPKDVEPANRTILNKHKQKRFKGKGHPAEENMEQGEANLKLILADLHGKESAVGEGKAILHTIATPSDDSVPGDAEWSKSSGDDQISRVEKGSSPHAEVEHLVRESRGDDAVTQKPTEDALIPYNHVKGTDNSATYEFSTAGPATTWGILQSNYSVGEIGPGGDHEDNHDDVQGADSIAVYGTSTPYEFLEPAGPATMWGILQSNQIVGAMGTEGDNDDYYKDVQGADSTGEDDTDTRYEYHEPAGPATLWGILQSNQTSGECDAEGKQDETSATQEPISGANLGQDMDCDCREGIDATYEFSEPAGPATMWEILRSDQTTEETGPEGDHSKNTAPQDAIADQSEPVDNVIMVDHGCEGGRSQDYEFSQPSGAATLWGILRSNQDESCEPTRPAAPLGVLQSNQDKFSESTDPATPCGQPQSSPCEEMEDKSAVALGEPGLAGGSNESLTDQEPGDQEPRLREPEVEEFTTELVQEEDYTQSKALAGEEAAPETGGPAPQTKEFYFDCSEIDVSGAQGSLDEPKGVSEIEISISHEAASTLEGNTLDEFGNDKKITGEGTAIGDVLNIQPGNKEFTIIQGQDDSELIDLPVENDSFDPLNNEKDLSRINDLEGEITTPATSPDTPGSDYLLYRDKVGGEVHQSFGHPDISTEPARTHSLPEPEIFEFPCAIPKPRSKAEIKASRKKAEHKRYKAKKKAEAAAKRRLKEEEEKGVAEEVEALEPPKTLAQSQAEEDMRLGDRRLEQQARRQEQQDRAASLRGLVRSSRAHLIY